MATFLSTPVADTATLHDTLSIEHSSGAVNSVTGHPDAAVDISTAVAYSWTSRFGPQGRDADVLSPILSRRGTAPEEA